jgi:excisionase family DNA binding protein
MYENIPEVMTLKECQQLLRVGKNTMLELVHTRQLDAIRIGNRWKIRKDDFIEFIEHR